MSASTPVPSSASKAPRRRSNSKAKKSGPSAPDSILKVLSSPQQRGGVSLVALKKALAASGYDVERNNSRIKLAVKRLVASGRVIQTKGTGASGSFKIGSKAAKKPKKAKAKRSPKKTATKLGGAKKSPKKKGRNLRSPVKASKTAKKTTTPKRNKRRASRSSKAKTANK